MILQSAADKAQWHDQNFMVVNGYCEYWASPLGGCPADQGSHPLPGRCWFWSASPPGPGFASEISSWQCQLAVGVPAAWKVAGTLTRALPVVLSLMMPWWHLELVG